METAPKHRGSWKEFLKRKQINFTVQTYFIDALGAMAFGLFASLLIGTIFSTIGEKTGVEVFNTIASYAKGATGAALGVSIAYALKAPQLVLFSAATVGIAGNELGGPVGALVATIVAAELGKLVSKETRVDILVTPGVTIISGVFMAQFVGPGVSRFMTLFGEMVKTATEMQPFFMGILVSALIGIALTLPISSAAICIMLSLDGLAGGAATAGCCAQMVGFAVMSFKENGWGGLFGPGPGDLHAPDGKHREKPQDLDCSHPGVHGHRPPGHHGLSAGKHPGRRGHGDLRSCGPHRHLYRHVRRRPQDVGRDPHDLFHPSRRPHLDLRRALQEGRMDP